MMRFEALCARVSRSSWMAVVLAASVALSADCTSIGAGSDAASENEPASASVDSPSGGNTTVSSLQVDAKELALTSAATGGTYPRALLLHNGTILTTFTRFVSGTSILMVAKSTDGGHTFVDLSSIARSVSQNAVDNAVLLELPSSGGNTPTLLAAFRNHDLDASGNYTYFRITICQSTDEGASWSYLSQAAEKSAPNGLWEPCLRIRSDGAVQMAYSLENSTADQDIVQKVSFDGGATWGAASTLIGDGLISRAGMPGIADAHIGNQNVLVMVLENTQDNRFVVQYAISYDEGGQYCSPLALYTPKAGHNAGDPQITSFADHSLVAIFMTDEDSDTVNWVLNARIKASLGPGVEQNRLVWQAPQLVSEASSFWPGLLTLDAHTALSMYDHGSVFGRRLVTQ